MVRIMLAKRPMRQNFSLWVVLAAVWLGTGGSAVAQRSQPGESQVSSDDHASRARRLQEERRIAAEQRRGQKLKKPRKGEHAPEAQVPELDPNSAGLAFLLLAGSAMLLVDRRRLRQV
jgi:hypothetical protein